jgi:hypothetical protein
MAQPYTENPPGVYLSRQAGNRLLVGAGSAVQFSNTTKSMEFGPNDALRPMADGGLNLGDGTHRVGLLGQVCRGDDQVGGGRSTRSGPWVPAVACS